MEQIKRYFEWRPIFTADGFWVALLKAVPYEITSAFLVIRSIYPSVNEGGSTLVLLLILLALSAIAFVLIVSGATLWHSLGLALCFLLFGLAIDAPRFRILFDSTFLPVWLADALIYLTQPHYLLPIAVLIVLSSSTLRRILGRPNPEAP